MTKLTSKARNALPTSDFALPESRKFPVTDHTHAVNALARSANKPESVKERVHALVYKKFPELKKHEGK